MLIYIYILLIILNSLIYVARKREEKLLSYLSMVFIILFIAGRRYDGSRISYDLVNYYENYLNAETLRGISLGYSILNVLGNKLSLPFNWFYMIITGICMMLIFSNVYKYKSNIHVVCIAYLLYFILIPCDQIKNICAYSIYLTGFGFLFKNCKYSIIKYVIFVILSGLFHPSYFLYLCFVVVKLIKSDKFYKYLVVILVVTCALIVIMHGQDIIREELNRLLAVLPQKIYARYGKYIMTQTHLSSLASIAIFLLCIMGLLLWIKWNEIDFINGCANILKVGNNELSEINTIKNVFLVSSVFLPMLLLNATTYRFIRDISLICIIYISSMHSEKYCSSIKRRIIILCVTYGVSVGWFIFDIVIKGYWHDFVEHFFINVIL